MTTATFKALDTKTAQALASFIGNRNYQKSIEIDGRSYTLVYISRNSSAFFRSRGLSAYFKTGRSIVRISDHWAMSEGYDKSRKLNCGSISGKNWVLSGKTAKVICDWNAGRFGWEMLAGICGLASLNKTCDHFSA